MGWIPNDAAIAREMAEYRLDRLPAIRRIQQRRALNRMSAGKQREITRGWRD